MHVVCVTFTARPGKFDRLLDLVRAQAANSLNAEPDCKRFDICVGEDGLIFLYELYTDEAAFRAHLETPHFLDFDQRSGDLVANKSVSAYRLID